MNEDTRIKRVKLIDERLFEAFKKLEQGTSEEKQLKKHLDNAIADLKINPLIGIKIPNDCWPKEYIKKYKIDNLRKYNLPNAWRLIYTINGNEVEVISIILEWMTHKNYDRKFNYKSN